jgi:Concanavalin A-like lectin/glucanases superfamily
MTTVTGLTADRMLAIEAASVVDGDVVGDNLILTKKDGTQINAGNVRGPQGIQGPVGQDLVVVASKPVLDVGLLGQIRAGRQLAAVDFTNMGLSAPLGLWNLSDLTDVSGNGRNLSNKGAVPFGTGINGGANTAGQFVGSAAQALYIPDTGAADPFRIKTGSWGAWFRTARRGVGQGVLSKMLATNLNGVFRLYINGLNGVSAGVAFTVNGFNSGSSTDREYAASVTDVCDDKWHQFVATYDGIMIRIYIDSVLEAVTTTVGGPLFAGTGPLNIGGDGGDAGTATNNSALARVDEAFVTADVLTDVEVRNLYCAKIAHVLAAVPSRVSLSVRRARRGSALLIGDFAVQPLRLHNFSAASLGDEGSQNIPLTNAAGYFPVNGADGTPLNAFHFSGGGGGIASTDAGLPAGLATRSYGCWFKTTGSSTGQAMLSWGTVGTNQAQIGMAGNSNILTCASGADVIVGPFAGDGQWHFIVVVEDNAAADGAKRKLYLDGRIVGTSVVMNAINLVGANRFRVGAQPDATLAWNGEIDSVFVSGVALTTDEIVKMYAKRSQVLPPSPKNAGDHVEGMSATDLLAIFDTLDSTAQVDLGVAA